MNKFKELKVWQKAIDLIVCVYNTTDTFPVKEQYNLISQINRAAVSIAANVAEGAGRETKKDFNRFLSISMGSSAELETLLIISSKLNFIKEEELNKLCSANDEIQRMLYSLMNSNKL
jgi:four helix bundle protein